MFNIEEIQEPFFASHTTVDRQQRESAVAKVAACWKAANRALANEDWKAIGLMSPAELHRELARLKTGQGAYVLLCGHIIQYVRAGIGCGLYLQGEHGSYFLGTMDVARCCEVLVKLAYGYQVIDSDLVVPYEWQCQDRDGALVNHVCNVIQSRRSAN